MTLWPIAVIVAGVITCWSRLCCTPDEGKKERIREHFASMFIVLCYIVMPSNSVFLLRIFLCDSGFGDDLSMYYLKADYGVQCWIPQHYAMIAYAIVMIVVYPVGINLMFFALLFRNRAVINPSHQGVEAAAIIERQRAPQIRYLSFIYKYYRPSCYLFEISESVRRLLLGGIYVFFSDSDSVKCFVAFVVSLVFFVFIRETMPFVSHTDNTLLVVAQLQIVLTFLAGFLLAGEPFDIDKSVLGWGLLLVDLVVVAVAVWMQYKHGSAALESELKLMEHEFRDAEMALTMAEMRSDVDTLQARVHRAENKTSGGNIREDQTPLLSRAGSSLTTFFTGVDPAPPPAPGATPPGGRSGGNGTADISAEHTHAGLMLLRASGAVPKLDLKRAKTAPARLPLSAQVRLSAGRLLNAVKPSNTELHEALYPCYVISLSKLQQMETLEQHEALLEKDALEVLTRTSRTPSGAFTFFISQNWESKTSPDNTLGTKLAWMKNLRDHLAIPPSIEIWVWWDLISIPQRQRRAQLRAIASLPNYASLCSRFIPLVRDGDVWRTIYEGDLNPMLPQGTLAAYLKRGWCRLELVAALCPKRLGASRAWRPGPLNLRFRYHQSPSDAGVGRLITAADLLDPRKGDFHRADDAAAMLPVLEKIALEYQEYEDSGSQVWDTLIDVSARPQWLKDLATEARGGRGGLLSSSRSASWRSARKKLQAAGAISSTGAGAKDDAKDDDGSDDADLLARLGGSSTRAAGTAGATAPQRLSNKKDDDDGEAVRV